MKSATGHLDEAKSQLEAGCAFHDERNNSAAKDRIGIASVHAQIAIAERLTWILDALHNIEATLGDA